MSAESDESKREEKKAAGPFLHRSILMPDIYFQGISAMLEWHHRPQSTRAYILSTCFFIVTHLPTAIKF